MTDTVAIALANPRFVPPPRVMAVMEELDRSTIDEPCGRTTKRGGACPRPRSRYVAACFQHVTPDERYAHQVALAASRAFVDNWRDSLTPACWDWPVVDADRAGSIDKWQARRCAMCGGRGDSLVVDHDHETGLVRGLLCVSCNITEARADDQFEKYRQRPPAAILGVEQRYWSPFTGYAKPQQPRVWLNSDGSSWAERMPMPRERTDR